MIQALHAQYPNITQLIPVQYQDERLPPQGHGVNRLLGLRRAAATPVCPARPVPARRFRDAVDVQHDAGERHRPPARSCSPPGTRGRTTTIRPRTGISVTFGVRQPERAQLAALGERPGPGDHGQARDGRDRRADAARPSRSIAAINADPAASAILWAEALPREHEHGDRRSRSRRRAGAPERLPLGAAGERRERGSRLPAPAHAVPRCVLRICKVCDGSKTGFFVYAQEHAREWVGPLVALETANRLLKNYGRPAGRRRSSTTSTSSSTRRSTRTAATTRCCRAAARASGRR